MAPAEVHVALPERVPVLQVMVGLLVSAMVSDAAEQTPPLVTAHVTAQSEDACGVAQSIVGSGAVRVLERGVGMRDGRRHSMW